jgi:hypothetical protein
MTLCFIMSEKDDRQFEGDITINDLYPELSPAEQQEAEYRLYRYLAVVKDIFGEIRESKPELLTELKRRAMLRKKRNNLS